MSVLCGGVLVGPDSCVGSVGLPGPKTSLDLFENDSSCLHLAVPLPPSLLFPSRVKIFLFLF
jgi:hypothetical protein